MGSRSKAHQPESIRRNHLEAATNSSSHHAGKPTSGNFAMGSYKGPAINYHCNPLENVTTVWDDEGDDDYSRSISGSGFVNGEDDDSQSDDGTEEMASSVYDNSPVVYRPPRGKPQPPPQATQSARKHLV